MRYILIYFSIKYQGNYSKILNALERKEKVESSQIEWVKKLLDDFKINAITIIDNDYPNQFKNILYPPIVIFYIGNKELLEKDSILLTGQQKNEEILSNLTKALNQINNKLPIVNLSYKGLDEEIVNSCLKNNQDLILVSPNGFNKPYFVNKIDINNLSKNVLIISECFNNVNLSKRKFLCSNRIAAGVASKLVILSSKTKSGINNLVSFFLNNGKDIYCFNQNETINNNDSFENGNAKLILEGANEINSINEIFQNEN